ncbi:hypothetical protein [Kocuria arenosa]|uniref:hypothetical protein n=1 Tax=Kocuria arenosa TaxID=3071446 RepID=UPI0034D428B8
MTSKLTSGWMLNPQVNQDTATTVVTRTTSFIAYLDVLVAIAVTAPLVGDDGTENGAELFEYPAPPPETVPGRPWTTEPRTVPSPPLYIWLG